MLREAVIQQLALLKKMLFTIFFTDCLQCLNVAAGYLLHLTYGLYCMSALVAKFYVALLLKSPLMCQ